MKNKLLFTTALVAAALTASVSYADDVVYEGNYTDSQFVTTEGEFTIETSLLQACLLLKAAIMFATVSLAPLMAKDTIRVTLLSPVRQISPTAAVSKLVM